MLGMNLKVQNFLVSKFGCFHLMWTSVFFFFLNEPLLNHLLSLDAWEVRHMGNFDGMDYVNSEREKFFASVLVSLLA